MPLPTISTINFTTALDDREVQATIRAVNRQIREDFASVWGAVWELRLHASEFDPDDPETLAEEPIRGEGVLYLTDEDHLESALGYHALNAGEKPYGFVFLIDRAEWTVTLSHEALELIIDPTANVLVPGSDPRPGRADKVVLHAYEVCDAVERTGYDIDGIRVSNFITQQWFVDGDAAGTRNDFLGVGVDSFRATDGSHLAFFDLDTGTWEQILGQEKARTPRLAARQAIFERERPRPKDGQLLGILEHARANPPKIYAQQVERTLREIRGVTRTERRRYAAERIGGRQ